MSFLADLAWMTTATTGTGTITLGSAVSTAPAQAFASGVNTGDWIQYTINDTGNAFEVGFGKYSSSGTTLTRNLISSSTGSLLSLSGSATVFVDAGAATLLMPFAPLFGTGCDGALSSGFGTITLTRDTCYGNITFGVTDQIITAGYLLLAQSCDISAAQSGAIVCQAASAVSGNAGSGSTGGATLTAITGRSTGNGYNGGAGGTGTNTTGGNGSPGTLASSNSPTYSGQAGGNGGVGGAGVNAAGTAGSSSLASGVYLAQSPAPLLQHLSMASSTSSMPTAGPGGAGGSAGGGSGTSPGGGGGGGAASAPPLKFSCRLLVTGSNSNVGVIANIGGTGGVGGVGGGSGAGGGGGGGGAPGGQIYIVIGQRIGSVITNGLDASSGVGGAGGNGVGSGIGGTGGQGGYAGGIEVVNIAAASYANTAPVNARNSGSAGSGTTGGAGGASKVAQQNL